MAGVRVMTDTNASLDFLDHTQDIPIVRSIITLGDNDYVDTVELSASDFYSALSRDHSLFPRTAQPPMERMISAYKQLKKDGASDIVFITISSKMSGIYQTAQIAAKEVSGVNVHVFDSRSVAYPQAAMTLKAHRMAQENASATDILSKLDAMRQNNHIYFAVDTLRYLVMNGRLTGAQGMMGSMLKIKPLLEIDADGAVVSLEKIRTFKRALNKVVEHYQIKTAEIEDVTPFICHANNEAAADYLEKALKEQDAALENILRLPLTPAVGAHAGPGAIGLGYIKT